MTTQRPRPRQAEELFRQVAGFASFGFNKSHAAAFARTAYESAFLKLFYPAQFTVGLINAQPMGFYPVEVLINDAKRHGVAVLPVDLNASRYRTTTEWVGMPGEPLPDGAGIDRRPEVVRSPACVVLDEAARDRCAAPRAPRATASASACTSSTASARQLGERLERSVHAAGPTARWPTWSPGRGSRRRSSSGSSGPARSTRWAGRGASSSGSSARSPARPGAGPIAGPAASPTARPPPAGHRGARPAAAERARAPGRQLRHPLARRAPPGHRALPAGARPARGADRGGAGRAAPGPGGHRRPRRHAAAPDDRQGHRLPGRSRTRPAWST